MLEGLTSKLDAAFKKIRGKTTISVADVQEAIKEVRLALLEADVNFKLTKDFCAKVSEKAVGESVLKSLSPGQQVVKIVHDELVTMLGTGAVPLNVDVPPPAVIVLAGLQGAGKTTTASKLALYLKNEKKKKVLLVSVDVYRPAAIKQLETLARGISVDFLNSEASENPITIATRAKEYAKNNFYDVLIIDTAGRLQIDTALMDELSTIVSNTHPSDILLVADAMTGQEAVNVATGFKEAIHLTGLILTKFDGDARGGAALSMRAVTGVPIKFIGISEKADGLEPFHPERLATRILGMGDVMTLIEKAQKTISEEDTFRLQEKMEKGQFTLEDFLEQMKSIKKMGSITSLAGMIPGMQKAMEKVDPEHAEGEMKRIEAIILSMTVKERRNHTLLSPSRRQRIAAGSGTKIEHVHQLIKQFTEMKKMMEMLTKGGLGGMIKMMGGGLGGLGKGLMGGGLGGLAQGLGGAFPGFGGSGLGGMPNMGGGPKIGGMFNGPRNARRKRR